MNFIKLLMIVIFLYTNLLAQKKCGSNTQTMKKIEYKKAINEVNKPTCLISFSYFAGINNNINTPISKI